MPLLCPKDVRVSVDEMPDEILLLIQRKSIHSIAHLSRNSGHRHRHPHATPSPSHREFRFTFPPHPEGDELKRERKDGLHPQIRFVLSEITCGIGSTDPTT
jgi:hypothetical protein